MRYEYEIEVPKMLLPEFEEPVIRICVSKIGGGTLGESYTGRWRYRVGYAGRSLIRVADDLTTGTEKTHEQAAQIIAGYLSSGEYDIPESQHDRLALFAEGE